MPRKKKRNEPRSPAPAPAESEARWRWAALVVALATFATFARGIDAELLTTWDDGRFIPDFPPVHAVTVGNLVRIWSETHFEAYHPLHLMSYWLDVPWAGANAVAIHSVSAVLWALAMTLVLGVMRGLGLGLIPAVIATLVFGLHPVQVEAVTWATGRKEIVALTFACLAILAHLRSRSWRDGWSWTARACFVLAALGKTTVLPLPAFLFAMDVLLRDVPWRKALARQIPTFAVAAALGVVVLVIWETNEMTRAGAAGGTALGRVSLVLATLTHLLETAFAPVGLSPVYELQLTDDFGSLETGLGLGVVLAALAAAWRWRLRWLAFSTIGFVVLALPVLNFIPLYWLRADRYLSLPLLALAFGVGAVVEAVPWRRAASFAAAVVVVLLAARTVTHSVNYTSNERLWTHAVRVEPTAYMAWLKLGETRRDAGDLDGAVRAHRRAARLAPNLRLTQGALFYSTALRDERRPGFAPPEDWDLSFCAGPPITWTNHVSPARRAELDRQTAWRAMRCYYLALNRPERLSVLGGELIRGGYRDAVLLVLERLLALEPIADDQLERAARIHLAADRRWLAQFYASRMRRPAYDPAVRALVR